MGTQARAIPAPNFDSKIHDSTIQTKANPWLEVIQERSSSQLYGVRKQKRDYDRPKGEYGRPFGNGNHHDEDFGGGGQPSFHKKQKVINLNLCRKKGVDHLPFFNEQELGSSSLEHR